MTRPTLCVRLDGPLAAYGGPSTFTSRYTEPDPTLSAIQGMLAAALGIRVGQHLPEPIVNLNPIIREERPGYVLHDYHTINQTDPNDYPGLDTDTAKKNLTLTNRENRRASFDNVVTERYYLNDAGHLLFLHDPDHTIETALNNPTFSPYLGRTSCPPTEPFVLGRSPLPYDQAALNTPTVTQPDDLPDKDHYRRTIVTFQPVGAYHDLQVRTDRRYDRTTTHRTHIPQDRYYHHANIPAVDRRPDQPRWEPIAAALQGQP